MPNPISGFSKLSKSEKIEWLLNTYFTDKDDARRLVEQYWNSDEKLQKLHDEFIENTITNYYLPLGVAPNFQINDKLYTIPMAIEESSVVAAASKAAKFWLDRGGFKAEVISTIKIGQVHFIYKGDFKKLEDFFKTVKLKLISSTSDITKNMERRGGGILDIELRDKSEDLENYYQLHATFETLDAMGANFINSCLEQFAITFKSEAQQFTDFNDQEEAIDIVMSILSNYVPNCLVRAEVSCKFEDLKSKDISNPEVFVHKFKQAVNIAEIEPYRAVTHNKGIMNGIDAVVLATGNDFRAVEAGVHAYASRNGKYSSLTHCTIENGIFKFWIEIPLALGTVGGLTGLHPLVKFSLELLENPTAKDLMQIVAVAGLAQNFAALKSLTTTGIQEGHMKMHLMNILNQFEATTEEKTNIVAHFKTNIVTHSAVVEAIKKLETKLKTFKSNGKLLLTAEYVVLDGAKALAIPTKYGQSLTVEENTTKNIVWKSYNELDDVWFEDEFLINDASARLKIKAKNYTDISKRLIQILKTTYGLNPEFLNSKQGYTITTHQDFNRLWGLGTSSTLINNIANWAQVDAYKLLEKTFRGSGYDIACAQNDTPITYLLKYRQKPLVETINFDPSFKSQLYFVYLNQKQNSRDGIASYKKKGRIDTQIIDSINILTEAMITCESLSVFESLIITHENIISELIEQKPIKSRLFKDFKGAIKSLGAWGGDFVLVTSETDPTDYFSSKGFDTIIPYKDMVLN